MKTQMSFMDRFVAGKQTLNEILKREQYTQLIKDQEIVIGIIGDLKTGKSATINALVRTLINPSTFHPMTARAIMIRNGPRLSVQLFGKDGSVQDVQITSLEDLSPEIFQVPGDRRSTDRIAYVSIEIPGIPLLENGVILMDLPGVNENETLDSVVIHNVKRFSAVVCVMDAIAGLTLTSVQILIAVLREKPDLPVLYVANKMDLLQPSFGGPSSDKLADAMDRLLSTLFVKIKTTFGNVVGTYRDSPNFQAISSHTAGNAIMNWDANERKIPLNLPSQFVMFETKLMTMVSVVAGSQIDQVILPFQSMMEAIIRQGQTLQIIEECEQLLEWLPKQRDVWVSELRASIQLPHEDQVNHLAIKYQPSTIDIKSDPKIELFKQLTHMLFVNIDSRLIQHLKPACDQLIKTQASLIGQRIGSQVISDTIVSSCSSIEIKLTPNRESISPPTIKMGFFSRVKDYMTPEWRSIVATQVMDSYTDSIIKIVVVNYVDTMISHIQRHLSTILTQYRALKGQPVEHTVLDHYRVVSEEVRRVRKQCFI